MNKFSSLLIFATLSIGIITILGMGSSQDFVANAQLPPIEGEIIMLKDVFDSSDENVVADILIGEQVFDYHSVHIAVNKEGIDDDRAFSLSTDYFLPDGNMRLEGQISTQFQGPGSYEFVLSVVDLSPGFPKTFLDSAEFEIIDDTPSDIIPPVITLRGITNLNLEQGGYYFESGATCIDNVDGQINGNVVISGDTVDTSAPISTVFTIDYDCDDNSGNSATTVQRTVTLIPAPLRTFYVSAENSQFDNYMSGPQVIEVIVIDSSISSTDVALGEPDVTVNGKTLRMAQAVDGNWYGYFADRDMAQIADSTAITENGIGLDYGDFCESSDDIDALGIGLSDTVGFAVSNTDELRGQIGSSTGGTIFGTNCMLGFTPGSTFFEYDFTTSLDGWQYYSVGNSLNTVPNPTDNYSLSLDVSDGQSAPSAMISGDGYAINAGMEKQFIIPNDATQVILTFDGKAQGTLPSHAYIPNLRFDILDENDQNIYGEYVIGPSNPSSIPVTNWETFSIDITDHVLGQNEVSIVLGLADSWTVDYEQKAWFDNISVEIISPSVSNIDTMNVLRESRDVNPGNGNDVSIGQIGLNSADNWPFIQLYSLNPTGNVVVQYNYGGSVETTTLTFDTVENLASFELDRNSYFIDSQVYPTITDVWLNIDPTDEDSWTFGTYDTISSNYQVFDEHGVAVGDTLENTDNNLLTGFLDSLMCEDNCRLLIDPNTQGATNPVLTLQDNDDTGIVGTDANDATSFQTLGGNLNGKIPITITETNNNNGVFVMHDESDSSILKITDNAARGTSGTIDYNEEPKTILVVLPPILPLNIGDASVNEDEGTVLIPVTWNPTDPAFGGLATFTFAYATSDGTAIAGSDYTAFNIIITHSTASGIITLSFPITDDVDVESDETFTVTLTDPNLNNDVIGTSVVTIIDNDVVPVATFCNDMTIDELIASGNYNVIDNRDGHLDGSRITGTNGDDLILASDVGNDIRAKKGSDCVIGGAGNDQLRGGNGDDTIFGLDGNDRMIGGKQNDLLYGGEGNDKISGSNNNDQLFGENGDDIVNGGSGDDVLSCGDGVDKANGGKGTDTATTDCETVKNIP